MFGLRGKDWGRLIGLTLLGLILMGFTYAAILALSMLLPVAWCGLSPNPWSWIRVGLLLLMGSWICLFLPASGILALAPKDGRIRLGSLMATAGWVSLLLMTILGLSLWAQSPPLRIAWPLRIAGTFGGILPVVWCLTWSLDAVRRRRRALDASGKT